MTAEERPDSTTSSAVTDSRYKKNLKIMQVKFFQIPSGGCEAVEAEMNMFLRSHRIWKVERESP